MFYKGKLLSEIKCNCNSNWEGDSKYDNYVMASYVVKGTSHYCEYCTFFKWFTFIEKTKGGNIITQEGDSL